MRTVDWLIALPTGGTLGSHLIPVVVESSASSIYVVFGVAVRMVPKGNHRRRRPILTVRLSFLRLLCLERVCHVRFLFLAGHRGDLPVRDQGVPSEGTGLLDLEEFLLCLPASYSAGEAVPLPLVASPRPCPLAGPGWLPLASRTVLARVPYIAGGSRPLTRWAYAAVRVFG